VKNSEQVRMDDFHEGVRPQEKHGTGRETFLKIPQEIPEKYFLGRACGGSCCRAGRISSLSTSCL
jgi:hypothetical protein